MARLKGNNLQGKLGPMVHYMLNGQHVVRARPKKYKRTKNSVIAGKNFGRAATMGSLIRGEVTQINPAREKSSSMYRLAGELNNFVNWKEKMLPAEGQPVVTVPFLNNFQFNETAGLADLPDFRPTVQLTDNGLLEIQLPELQDPRIILKAPAKADHVNCHVKLISAEWTKLTVNTIFDQIIKIETQSPFPQPPVISIPITPRSNELLILVIALQNMFTRFTQQIEIIKDAELSRCGIVWVHFTR